MGKYKGHEEFGPNAPINWREKTTREAYLAGMSGIAPAGMKPREQRGRKFQEKTDAPASAKWHHNYDMAMFGGTEVPPPDTESKQQSLESFLDGIPRIPQTKRK